MGWFLLYSTEPSCLVVCVCVCVCVVDIIFYSIYPQSLYFVPHFLLYVCMYLWHLKHESIQAIYVFYIQQIFFSSRYTLYIQSYVLKLKLLTFQFHNILNMTSIWSFHFTSNIYIQFNSFQFNWGNNPMKSLSYKILPEKFLFPDFLIIIIQILLPLNSYGEC